MDEDKQTLTRFLSEELETACSHCRGSGTVAASGSNKTVTCYNCDGRGHFPTDAGERILALLSHNLKLSMCG